MKSKLIPKNKLWISISMIIIPIFLLIVMKLLNYPITIENAKAITSFSFLGLFLLFVTKWTKEDGDEMYFNFRLIATFSAIVFGIIMYIISSWLNVFDIFQDGTKILNSQTELIFLIVWWQLFIFGIQVLKANVDLKNNK